MQKYAQLVLTSYNSKTIDVSIESILSQALKMNISVKGKPVSSMVTSNKKIPMWGCEKNDVKRKSVLVSGSVQDLMKLIRIETPEGVYIQLIPQ